MIATSPLGLKSNWALCFSLSTAEFFDEKLNGTSIGGTGALATGKIVSSKRRGQRCHCPSLIGWKKILKKSMQSYCVYFWCSYPTLPWRSQVTCLASSTTKPLIKPGPSKGMYAEERCIYQQVSCTYSELCRVRFLLYS